MGEKQIASAPSTKTGTLSAKIPDCLQKGRQILRSRAGHCSSGQGLTISTITGAEDVQIYRRLLRWKAKRMGYNFVEDHDVYFSHFKDHM